MSGFAPARHIFFVLAATATLMSTIDDTIVAVAIPQLTSALNAPLVWVAWTITSYQLVQAVMLPLSGKLSDSFGRKRVFLLCVGTFTVGSLLCGLAPNIWFLIAARVVQGIGGGGLIPSAIGVISDRYREHRAQARGLFSSAFPIGGIIGPNLGGFILEHWTWREMFFINVPIGIVVLVGVGLLLRGEVGVRKKVHIDVPGLALFTGAIVLLLAAMTAFGEDPGLWRNPLLWAAVLISVALGVIFLRYIRRAADPVMDYELVVRQPFLSVNLYAMFYGSAIFGFTSFIPTFAVTHFGLNALQSGEVLTPRSAASIVMSIIASIWIIRLGYRGPMLAGILLVSLSLALLGTGWTSVQIGTVTLSGFWLLALMPLWSGMGNGLAGPASGNASLDLAPEHAAQMTGLRGMFRLTGSVLTVSGIVLALTFFPDAGEGLTVIFRVMAVLVLLAIPLVFMVPDGAREKFLADQRSGALSAAPEPDVGMPSSRAARANGTAEAGSGSRPAKHP